MNSGKYVFTQFLQSVNKYEFDKCVKRYNGDYPVRELNCWNLFVLLFFGQLTSLNSLRDICTRLKAHMQKLCHLGIKQNVNQSILSRANERRDWRIFAEFGEYLIQRESGLCIQTILFLISISTMKFLLWTQQQYL